MKIALGVSGGIAAYKAAEIVRQLQERGVRVQVIMTAAAQEFVRPLTFAALSGEKVITSMFGSSARAAQSRLRRRAHLGCAIDRLPAGRAGHRRHHRQVRPGHRQRFPQHAVSRDHCAGDRRSRHERQHVGASGDARRIWRSCAGAACTSSSRAADIWLAAWLARAVWPSRSRLSPQPWSGLGVAQDLAGETVLITAGPTHEPIDPVRYLGNRSSGKMGYALAEAALRRGAKVILVSGPTALQPPVAAETIFVETAQQMRTAVLDRWEQASIIIMAAAVADYHVKNVSPEKIKRNGAMELQLEPNPDILADLGSLRQASGKTHADADRLRRRNREPAGERARQADQQSASTPSC